MNEIKQKEQELIDKLEKEKLEEITVYTIELGLNKYSTTDKDIAFKMWQSLSENFFSLETAGESRYSSPYFNWKQPFEVKLIGEKKQVWKNYESAQQAAYAFKVLTAKKPNKSERDEEDFS